MHSHPNREPLSPVGAALRMGLRGVNTYCPCCGGSLGVRAAFRFRPFRRYEIDWRQETGHKGTTLRTHRIGR